jgi:hypothetical protein
MVIAWIPCDSAIRQPIAELDGHSADPRMCQGFREPRLNVRAKLSKECTSTFLRPLALSCWKELTEGVLLNGYQHCVSIQVYIHTR